MHTSEKKLSQHLENSIKNLKYLKYVTILNLESFILIHV
jgi:hypothetical protein